MTEESPVLIRRYGNRRLYDTSASVYVNLSDLRTLVGSGRKIRVVDARTEEDVTRRVLTQIVLEAAEEDEEKGLPLELLYELARASDRAFRDFLEWYLRSSMEVYRRLQERWQEDARRRWGEARPALEAWAQLWDPRQVAATLAQLLSPLEAKRRGRGGERGAERGAERGGESAERTDSRPERGELEELRRRLDELEKRLESKADPE